MQANPYSVASRSPSHAVVNCTVGLKRRSPSGASAYGTATGMVSERKSRRKLTIQIGVSLKSIVSFDQLSSQCAVGGLHEDGMQEVAQVGRAHCGYEEAEYEEIHWWQFLPKNCVIVHGAQY